MPFCYMRKEIRINLFYMQMYTILRKKGREKDDIANGAGDILYFRLIAPLPNGNAILSHRCAHSVVFLYKNAPRD